VISESPLSNQPAGQAAPAEPERLEIACQSCGATIVLQPQSLTAICPFCASPSVLQRPASPDLPTPHFVVGFSINQDRAARLVRQWISKSHWFARSDFKKTAPELTRGVYLPAYLYGAIADASYAAEIGENYTETETYTTTNSEGKTVTRTRTVTKTEWRTLHGNYSCYVLDVLVTASRGVSNPALEAIEPFDLRTLRRFAPSLVSGWLAEAPTRSEQDCFSLAHDEAMTKVSENLAGMMPGDSHRNLRHQAKMTREVIDLVLLPVWTFAVRYAEDQPPVQILVNGQTGRVGGDVPVSGKKIAAVTLVALALIAVLAWLFTR